MKSVRELARKALPGFVYQKVYIGWKLFRNGKIGPIDRRLSRFVKREIVDVVVGSTKLKLLVDPENGGVDANIISHGAHEPAILNFMSSFLRDEDIAFDIGSNIGLHAIVMAKNASKVIGFEPIQRLFLQSARNALINDCYNLIIFNCGLGEKSGAFSISISATNAGSSSISVRVGRETESVLVRCLDDVVANLLVDRIDLIKIDVEGYEGKVLLGAAGSIAKFSPAILLEYSPSLLGSESLDVLNKVLLGLREKGWKLFDLGSGKEWYFEQVTGSLPNKGQTNLFACPPRLFSRLSF